MEGKWVRRKWKKRIKRWEVKRGENEKEWRVVEKGDKKNNIKRGEGKKTKLVKEECLEDGKSKNIR